jgi:type VI secretion system secreted protein Hcp
MAVVDYFLKIGDIEGESADSKHKGEIDIESWSWGASQHATSGSGGGGGAGKVHMQDLHFVMKMNKASPKLMLACATGKHYDKAVLTLRKAGGGQQEYAKITLGHVLVSSYQTGGSAQGDIVPLEQVSLNYDTIEMEYKDQKGDGTLGAATKAGWNQKENKPHP